MLHGKDTRGQPTRAVISLRDGEVASLARVIWGTLHGKDADVVFSGGGQHKQKILTRGLKTEATAHERGQRVIVSRRRT